MARGPLMWIRRLSLAAVLLVVAVAPGQAVGPRPQACGGSGPPGRSGCGPAGTVRWARLLPGSWIAQAGLLGTTPAQGQAYAALGDQVAAIGSGLAVSAYSARSGQPLWTADLAGFPAGSAIVSIRVWPGVVTAGVGLPPAAGAAAREEVVLAAATGRRIRAYPAAPFGGAVAASAAATVIVGAHAVTRYANRTGAVLWSRPTGRAAQAWQEDGSNLYVTVSAGGYLGTAPVTALRRISLRTGAERLVRPSGPPGPPGRAFAGPLSLAFDGVVLFAGAGGVTAYSGATGARLWHRRAGLPESVDVVKDRLYLLAGNALVGVDPRTGARLARVSGATAASAGLYGVRAGAVLGLDHGALGRAWGYGVATQRVLWTSAPLPWPHYFVDPSAIGGSTSPGSDGLLLAICAELGPPPGPGVAQPCLRPELTALNR
ncbi:MAG TPA: PQQ-binding-like beta-propeller repeat protein [Streptosporangiaceae bacterium]|nr:PQQ-binding-like beta-propeller repeat protein [Streptosporangiaceae bacterium]